MLARLWYNAITTMFENDVYPGGIIRPSGKVKSVGCAGAVGHLGAIIAYGNDAAFAFVVSWLRRKHFTGDTLLLSVTFVQGGSAFMELDVKLARQYWSIVDRGNSYGAE